MWTTEFEPGQRTVWLDVQLWGPLTNRMYSFVLDTGSLGVDGLLGMDLLVGRRILLDFVEGRVEVRD